eukprot:CAMPEP_0170480466 /NCGR_PEP_ID=MMETSP0208-20121228/1298_1 /TAXON_ID=197538 /ORGANISM="Strombidium inclinatum, Strain S3" /LENGTH=38 /DNA_ID= /DNA_START= /DNA_END= /DNA_ORIENTATION=
MTLLKRTREREHLQDLHNEANDSPWSHEQEGGDQSPDL